MLCRQTFPDCAELRGMVYTGGGPHETSVQDHCCYYFAGEPVKEAHFCLRGRGGMMILFFIFMKVHVWRSLFSLRPILF